ncbi:MAG: CARDB domain-containing protein, partial [Planctomycetota bacterium]
VHPLQGTPDYDLTVTAPDVAGANVVVESLSLADYVVSSTNVEVTAEVANLGDADAGAFVLGYFASADQTIDPGTDTPASDPIPLGGLTAGASTTDSPTLDLSALAPGFRYLGVVADVDAQVTETAETDNDGLAAVVLLPAPDALEPNDTAQTATEVTLTGGQAQLTDLTLHNEADADWFTFDLPGEGGATDHASLTYLGPDYGEPDLTLSLHDAEGSLLATAEGEAGTATLSLSGLEAETYLVQVSGLAEASFATDYSLAIDAAATGQASLGSRPAGAQALDQDVAPTAALQQTSPSAETAPVAPPSPTSASQPAAEPEAPTAGDILLGDSLPEEIVNSDFAVADPQDAGFGWTVRGAAAVVNGEGVLSEAVGPASGFEQIVALPEGAATVQFTLVGASFGPAGGNPPDAFEVVLLDPDTLAPLLTPASQPSGTDAILNVQPTGVAHFGPDVTVEGAAGSGDVIRLDQPVTVTADVSSLAGGTAALLGFDLMSFASYDSSVTIDGVATEFAAPALLIDTDTYANGRLNPTGPGPRSLGITALQASGASHFALHVGTDPADGWLHAHARGGRTDLYADGTAPEWRPAADWAGWRLRGLEPGQPYTFQLWSGDGVGPGAEVGPVGTFTTNADGDVNRSGLVTALDCAFIRAAMLTSGELGDTLAWACDVTDDGAVDAGDLATARARALNPASGSPGGQQAVMAAASVTSYASSTPSFPSRGARPHVLDRDGDGDVDREDMVARRDDYLDLEG